MGGFTYRYLLGRCANGFERDKGRNIHALALNDGRYGWRALCGAEPGRRSAGWTEYPQDEPTCPKCIRLLRAPPPTPRDKHVSHT